MPCTLVLQFHVLLFHALQIGPSISRPAFSAPPRTSLTAISAVAELLFEMKICTHAIKVGYPLRYTDVRCRFALNCLIFHLNFNE